MLRELDSRTSDGITTTLRWCPTTNALSVHVSEDGADPIVIAVEHPSHARLAFEHPFAYMTEANPIELING